MEDTWTMIGTKHLTAKEDMTKRKIVSTLIYPLIDGVRVEVTRQSSLFNISSGRLVRYYYVSRNNLPRLKSLVKWGAKLAYLMHNRIFEHYE
jgi:hypothetical protein